MLKDTFCTIITSNYLHFAVALHESLLQFNESIILHVFISDKWDDTIEDGLIVPKESTVSIYYIKDLCEKGIGKAIHAQYANKNKDHFRWSMKGVFISYLLEERDYEKVIYLDWDTYFFNDYHFLFEELNTHSILLTPHWRCAINPELDTVNFDFLFIHGLYNAGFLAANQKGIPALKKLGEWCLYECVNNAKKGKLDDQTYLNLLPIYFDDVKILKHRGCNVASWNLIECKRIKIEEEVLINGTDKVIFIHFLDATVQLIYSGVDKLLTPYLTKYLDNIQKINPQADFHKFYKLDIVDVAIKEKKRKKELALLRVQQEKKKAQEKWKKVEKISLLSKKVEKILGLTFPKFLKNIILRKLK